MRPQIQILSLASGLLLAACTGAFAADPFMLRSSSFEDNGKLAVKNAGNNKQNPNCVGENVSPPLAWSNPPAGTTSYALLMFDPEGRGGLGVSHWVAYGIPASVTGFAEGEVSKPSDKYVGGKSTPGLAYYFGPCTPPGDWHHYTFTLIATDLDPKALAPGLTRDEVFKAIDGHTKGAAGLIGRFTKPSSRWGRNVMAGHTRAKNGVASLAYVPAIHASCYGLCLKTWMPATSAGMTC